ncbi:MAG: hypothetical protein R3C10_01935 [Pirellulales bacterium]
MNREKAANRKKAARQRAVIRASAVLASLLFWLASAAFAWSQDERPGDYRSLQTSIAHEIDEIDLPRYDHRTSHIGQEYRTKHFVVTSMLGAENAQSVGDELEATWETAGRLADHWMDEHRNPLFGIAAVSVLVDNDPRDQAPWATGPGPTNFGVDVYVSVTGGESFGTPQLEQLRREATKSLFRVAQVDQSVPEWVQEGMAVYVARRREGPGPVEPTVAADTYESVDGASLIGNYIREAPDRLIEPPVDADADSAWVEFLLEGEDGRYAAQLFDFIRASVDAPQRQPQPTAAIGPGDGYLRLEGDMPWRPEAVLAGAAASPDAAQRAFRRWLADPHIGQPVLRWDENERVSNDDERVAAELVVALKLIQRFGEPESRSVYPSVVYGRSGGAADIVRPAVNEFGVRDGRPNVASTATGARAGNGTRTASDGPRGSSLLTEELRPLRQRTNLAELASRLCDPYAEPWATIDAKGELLLWTDRDRVDELALRLMNDYRVVQRDDVYRLAGRTPSGRTIEVWLTANPDNPRRPLARAEISRP